MLHLLVLNLLEVLSSALLFSSELSLLDVILSQLCLKVFDSVFLLRFDFIELFLKLLDGLFGQSSVKVHLVECIS